MEKRPVPMVICMVTCGDQILLVNRNSPPYKGYWALIGGKMESDESVEEAAAREIREETGLKTKIEGIRSVIHERLKEDKSVVFSGVVFLAHAETEENRVRGTKEGQLKWFWINELKDEKVVPQDVWMVEKFLENPPITISHLEIRQKDGKVLGFREV